ncbi:MAG: hypothetical protein RLY66_461 [Candidatus Parcubacteria bacterium]|jgi:cytochrome b involved in lipid metabolism
MSKKSVIIFIVIALVAIIGIVLATSSGNQSDYQPQGQDIVSSTPESTTTTDTSRMKMYGMTEVATHNNASSCWSAINGSVYDLTSWIGRHPGGEGAILSICGKDGSSAFNDQHGGERRPANELAGFKIGLLGQ